MDVQVLPTNPQPITNRSRLPRFQRVKEPPSMVMMERDKRILRTVYEYRMLTREQVERLLFVPEGGQDHFTKTSKARHRLKVLYQNKFLERVPLPVSTARWAWQPVYRLARGGAELVAADLGVSLKELAYWGKGDDKDRRMTDVTPLFLNHALQINDVRIAIALAARDCGYRIEKWLDDGQLKSQERKDYVTVSDSGHSRRMAVIPDGYFALHLGDRRAHFFLELDRATMSNSRWGDRVRAYLAYIRSGKYSERYRTTSLRILTVTTTEQRMLNLKETTQKSGGGNLFWFTTLDQVSSSSVLFRPIWRVANDEPGGARKVLLA